MSKLLIPEKPNLVVPDRPIVIAPKPARLVAHPGTFDRVRNWREALAFEERMRRLAAKLGVPLIAGAAAGSWTFTNNSRTNMLNGTFDFDTDTFKIALLASSSNIGASSNAFSSVTGELSTANGYTAGGITVTITLSGTTTVTVAFTQAQWTASGGDITARYACLYESGGNVVAYALCDSTPADVSATAGNTFTVAAGNVLSLA